MAKPPKKRQRSKPLAAEIGRTARYAVGNAPSDSKVAPATKRFVLGRGSFARISAVEGIHLTREMKRDLREFDRKGLSAVERRRAIVNKYGRKAT
jgi:hypothetical protein